jgi:glutamyl-tRNA reductase
MVERLSRAFSVPVGAETVPGGQSVAQERAIQAEPLCRMPSLLDKMDAVVCSTAAPAGVLNYEDDAETLDDLADPLLIVDIAVPRDVDPRLAALPNVQLCNIDDLGCRSPDSHADIAGVRKIVEQEVARFKEWFDSRRVVPTIKLLQQHLERLQKAEIERYGDDFSPEDRQNLEKFAESLCAKILHDLLAYLNEISSTSEEDEHAVAAEMVRRIFGLDSPD